MSKLEEELRKMVIKGSDILFDACDHSARVLRPPFGQSDLREDFAGKAVGRATRALLGNDGYLKAQPHIGNREAYKRALARHMMGKDTRFIVNTGSALSTLNEGLFEAARGFRINSDKMGMPIKLDWEQRAEAVYNAIQVFAYHLALLMANDIDQAKDIKEKIKGFETTPENAKTIFQLLKPNPVRIKT